MNKILSILLGIAVCAHCFAKDSSPTTEHDIEKKNNEIKFFMRNSGFTYHYDEKALQDIITIKYDLGYRRLLPKEIHLVDKYGENFIHNVPHTYAIADSILSLCNLIFTALTKQKVCSTAQNALNEFADTLYYLGEPTLFFGNAEQQNYISQRTLRTYACLTSFDEEGLFTWLTNKLEMHTRKEVVFIIKIQHGPNKDRYKKPFPWLLDKEAEKDLKDIKDPLMRKVFKCHNFVKDEAALVFWNMSDELQEIIKDEKVAQGFRKHLDSNPDLAKKILIDGVTHTDLKASLGNKTGYSNTMDINTLINESVFVNIKLYAEHDNKTLNKLKKKMHLKSKEDKDMKSTLYVEISLPAHGCCMAGISIADKNGKFFSKTNPSGIFNKRGMNMEADRKFNVEIPKTKEKLTELVKSQGKYGFSDKIDNPLMCSCGPLFQKYSQQFREIIDFNIKLATDDGRSPLRRAKDKMKELSQLYENAKKTASETWSQIKNAYEGALYLYNEITDIYNSTNTVISNIQNTFDNIKNRFNPQR